MDKFSTANEMICRIGNETFEKLKSLNVPPYPKYYYETFMDTLYKSKDHDTIELSKKFGYLFHLGASNDSLVENSLVLAKESLQQFDNTNESIRDISQKQEIELSRYTNDESFHSNELLGLMNTFHEQLIKELQKAEDTITKLQEEIEVLERESNIDPLTKAYNQKALISDLKEIVSFGKDRKLDMYLAILDADDFKSINDRFGHIAGDKTLIYLSKLLQSSLRRGTKIYRYEGDGFVILLNRVSHDDALRTVERILKETRESKLFYKGNNIQLTLSAGLTPHRQNDTPEELLDRAEKALNRAKKDGKQCYREE